MTLPTFRNDIFQLLYQCEAGRLMKECVAASIWVIIIVTFRHAFT